MITKVQSKALPKRAALAIRPKLTTLEKGMLRWAVVDPTDKVLDANVGHGLIAEYLQRNLQCEVCGVSDHMEDVRRARERLQGCDIIYAAAGDIPWREGSFDTVLLRLETVESDMLARSISEVKRVLKDGGQLVVGSGSSLLGYMHADEGTRTTTRKELMDALERTGFENLSMQRVSVTGRVWIAWKPKQKLEHDEGSV